VERVFDEAWDGEKVIAEAAASRVYVAINTLRNMGLRSVLKSEPSGYFLDPDVPVALGGRVAS
jgi:hypothetical protein